MGHTELGPKFPETLGFSKCPGKLYYLLINFIFSTVLGS